MVLPPLALVGSADATAEAQMKPLPKQLTTFSRTSGEITDQALPRSPSRTMRSRYAFGLLGVVAAVALAILLVRPNSPSVVTATPTVRTWPVAQPAQPAAPSISPLASTPALYAGEAESPKDGPSAGRNGVKKSHMTNGAASFESSFNRRSGKRKASSMPKGGAAMPLQPRLVKRTIIREL
jgi:hypothetical protein